MKRYHVLFTPYERGLLVNALNRFRTELLKENRDAMPVNEVLLKVIQAKSRPHRECDREAR